MQHAIEKINVESGCDDENKPDKDRIAVIANSSYFCFQTSRVVLIVER